MFLCWQINQLLLGCWLRADILGCSGPSDRFADLKCIRSLRTTFPFVIPSSGFCSVPTAKLSLPYNNRCRFWGAVVSYFLLCMLTRARSYILAGTRPSFDISSWSWSLVKNWVNWNVLYETGQLLTDHHLPPLILTQRCPLCGHADMVEEQNKTEKDDGLGRFFSLVIFFPCCLSLCVCLISPPIISVTKLINVTEI